MFIQVCHILIISYLQPRKPTAAIQGHPNFICIFLPLDPNNPWTPRNEGNVCSHGSRYWQFWPQEVGAQGSQIYTHQQIVFWQFETFAAASTTWLVVSTHLKNMFKLDHFPKDRAENSKNLWNHWIENKFESAADVFFLIRDLFNKTWQFWGIPWPSSGDGEFRDHPNSKTKFVTSNVKMDKKVTFFFESPGNYMILKFGKQGFMFLHETWVHSILNNLDYPVIWKILGLFSSPIRREIHHP